MSAYRLDPIRLNDPSWELSTYRQAIWVGTDSPGKARELAAGATLKSVSPRGGYLPKRQSPWLLAEVTSCVWDTQKEMPSGAVTTLDGKTLPLSD